MQERNHAPSINNRNRSRHTRFCLSRDVYCHEMCIIEDIWNLHSIGTIKNCSITLRRAYLLNVSKTPQRIQIQENCDTNCSTLLQPCRLYVRVPATRLQVSQAECNYCHQLSTRNGLSLIVPPALQARFSLLSHQPTPQMNVFTGTANSCTGFSPLC